MNDTPTQTIADALLLLSFGERNEIGKDASERLMKLERENAALRAISIEAMISNTAFRMKELERENAALRAILRDIRSNNWDGFELAARIAALKGAIDAARKEAQP